MSQKSPTSSKQENPQSPLVVKNEFVKNVAEDPIVGLLIITVVEAKDLPKMDIIGSADPYCNIFFGLEKRFRTSIIKNTKTPKWNQTFNLLVPKSDEKFSLDFEVWDWDMSTRNDFIGLAKTDLSAVAVPNKEVDLWLKIEPKSGNKLRGDLHIKLLMKDYATVEREFWHSIAQHFDTDRTGAIDMFEIIALLEALRSPASDDDINELFQLGNARKPIPIERFCDLMALSEENRKKYPILDRLFPDVHRIQEIIWNVVAKPAGSQDAGNFVLESGLTTPHTHRGFLRSSLEHDKIIVKDRETGQAVEEKIPEYIKVSMRLMYATSSGRFVVEHQAKKILNHITRLQGEKYDSPESKKAIPEFISFHGLNTAEMLEPVESYNNFNQFFYRKLKPNARPIASKSDPKVAICGADCRLHVFPSVNEATKLWIKGNNFTLRNLLQDDALASEYSNGSFVIWRLAPQDYHRFHSPISGTIASMTEFQGTYYTVNPIAVRENVDVYTENKRVRVVINSPQFGTVVYVAIGATMVGSVNFTKKTGQEIAKGDELGYFAFGGSTIIVLFKAGAIKFDEDLLTNSAKPIETLVRLGQTLGKAAK